MHIENYFKLRDVWSVTCDVLRHAQSLAQL